MSQLGINPRIMAVLRAIVCIGYIALSRTKHKQFSYFPPKVQGTPEQPAQPQEQQPPQLVITPDLIETLRGLLAQSQTTVTEEASPTLLLTEGSQESNNGERVRAYLVEHPKAPLREIAEALTISVTTANKWRGRMQGEGVQTKKRSKAKK